MKISDLVFGTIFVAFAIFILVYSRTLPSLPGYAYGSGFFPSFTAIFMLGGGIALIARGIKLKKPLLALGEWTRSPKLISNICLIPLNLVFYILVSEKLGFVPTTFLMMSVTIWWLRGKLLQAVTVAAASSLLTYGFFAKLMLVPLPPGILNILGI